MELIYRGRKYQMSYSKRQTELVTVPSEITGVYRGAKFHVRKVANPPESTGFSALTYRRASYRSLRYSPCLPMIKQID